MRADRGLIRAFTDNQRAVIENGTYPVYCKSGAGTGKTEILVQKEIELLKNGARIDEIFTITFTNKAANEMRERLNDRLYYAWVCAASEGDPALTKRLRRMAETSGTFQVSTIHGFCESLLREYGAHIGLSSDFRRDSFNMGSREIIDRIVTDAVFPPAVSSTMGYKLAGLISDILDDCGNRGIALSDAYLENCEHDQWFQVKDFVLKLCIQAGYEIVKVKEMAKVLTLNDLMTATLRLLQNTYALSKITSRCKWLFCDEYQDTDSVQFQIIQTLMNAGVNVFLIGDDQQSIYAYRGADIKSSQKAYEIIHSIAPSEQVLNENFRSDPAILQTVNRLFSKRFRYRDTQLHFPFFELLSPEHTKAMEGTANPYRIIHGAKPHEVIKRIIERDTIDGRPVSYEDIYVLCRTNLQVASVENELKAVGLPVVTVGGKGFYCKKEIIDLYKLFNAILKSGSVYRNELAFTDYYIALTKHTEISLADFLAELDSVFREESIDNILEFIYDKSGILAYYDHIGDYQAVANLNKLRNIASEMLSREYMQPLDFMEYLHKKIESRAEEDEAEIDNTDKKKGFITVMTIHKAKGLSLPVVVIPGIERRLVSQKNLPDFLIDLDKMRFTVNDLFGLGDDPTYSKMLRGHIISHLEEELRVLYVAMTRAKHMLILSSTRDQRFLTEMAGKEDYVSWWTWIKS